MELQAVIAGLSELKERSAVRVVTDSQCVQRAMTRHLSKWIARLDELAWRACVESRSVGSIVAREQPA
jgi:ribonuclease HI